MNWAHMYNMYSGASHNLFELRVSVCILYSISFNKCDAGMEKAKLQCSRLYFHRYLIYCQIEIQINCQTLFTRTFIEVPPKNAKNVEPIGYCSATLMSWEKTSFPLRVPEDSISFETSAIQGRKLYTLIL